MARIHIVHVLTIFIAKVTLLRPAVTVARLAPSILPLRYWLPLGAGLSVIWVCVFVVLSRV